MKKHLLIATLILLIGITAAQPKTEIQVQDQNPGIADPGDTIRMDILVSNNGDSSGEYQPINIEAVPSIEYKGTTSNLAEEFSLCGGCQTTGIIYLKVRENASSGTYPVDIGIQSTENIGVVEKSVVEVDGSSELILTGNGTVKQGESSEMKIQLENIGRDIATQTTVSLSHPLISFQPSKTSFGSLEPGDSAERSIEINTDEKIESGPETIHSTVEYREDGKRITKNSSVSLDILKDVEIVISQFKSDARVSSSSRTLVELENIGNAEAEGIRSELECEGASILDGESYVGSLEPDESVPTVYSISPEQEDVNCRVKISYTGEEEHTLEESFSITAEHNNSFMLPSIIGLVVVAGGLFYWRKKNNEEQ